VSATTEERALASLGRSDEVIYVTAARLLREAGVRGLVVDVGCGEGRFRALLNGIATDYIGIDAVRFDALPKEVHFRPADLDRDPLPLDDRSADAVVALETIEHLENPRRFVRELARVARPGGIVLVSTPNQLSALSLLSLLVRQHYAAFHGRNYPAHVTALLPTDLVRIAVECGLEDSRLAYSLRGRVPGTGWHYPSWLPGLSPRLLSDNVFMLCRRGR
jgi:SAM-dependent methyltransferase